MLLVSKNGLCVKTANSCFSNYMHASDAKIKTRLSEYKCKQWLIQQVALVAENKKVLNSIVVFHCVIQTAAMILHYLFTVSHLVKMIKKGRNSG